MPRTRKDWTQGEETKLLEMWGAGKTYKEMGEALGRTPKGVQQHVYYMQSHGKGRKKNDALQGAGEAGGEGSKKQGAADLRDGGHAEPAGRKVGVQRAGGEPAAVGRRELLAEIVRMVGRIPTEEAVTVRGSTEQHTMLDVTLARLSEAMQVDGAREIKATPLMYGSTMLWQTRDRQIIGLPEDAQAAVTMTREATTDALGTVMRFDTPEETFAAQTLENAAAMWQALALTSWVAWDDD